jgi:hypothetical protein
MSDPRSAARRLTSIDEIIEHLRELGHIESVEDGALTELDHGLQTAAILAATAPDDLGVQVAGDFGIGTVVDDRDIACGLDCGQVCGRDLW